MARMPLTKVCSSTEAEARDYGRKEEEMRDETRRDEHGSVRQPANQTVRQTVSQSVRKTDRQTDRWKGRKRKREMLVGWLVDRRDKRIKD